MHHCVAYMSIHFKLIRVSGSDKNLADKYFANNRKLHKFATANSNFEKNTFNSDMRHRKTYMYINFLANSC